MSIMDKNIIKAKLGAAVVIIDIVNVTGDKGQLAVLKELMGEISNDIDNEMPYPTEEGLVGMFA